VKDIFCNITCKKKNEDADSEKIQKVKINLKRNQNRMGKKYTKEK
jgi:hypothetical protein